MSKKQKPKIDLDSFILGVIVGGTVITLIFAMIDSLYS